MRINPNEISGSVFERVGSQWMLVSAEKDGRANAMTASWGGFGILWNKPVAFVFIRPQRYTFELLENSSHFGLSFLPEALKDAHKICGAKSGRDMDKLAASGLTARRLEDAPVIGEAELTLCCRKLFGQFLTADSFIDTGILPQMYPAGDLHKMYVGEITAVETLT